MLSDHTRFDTGRVTNHTFKMIFKIVFALSCLVVLVHSNPRPTPYNVAVASVVLEEPCVRQGGMCLRIEDCDPGNLVSFQGVLCPMQSSLGVECCYV